MINLLSSISPNKSTEPFSLEKIINSSCTSSFCGNEPVPQMVYHCLICDPKKKYSFCQFCYESCHNKCRSFNYYPSNSSFLRIKESSSINCKTFACDCGIVLKHIIKQIEKKELISCPLAIFDQTFLSSQMFYCDEDKMFLCSMCYFVCHKECLNKQQYTKGTKTKIKTINNSNTNRCQCKDINHTMFNEFTFQIPLFAYQNEINTSFWPIQMINMMFSTGTIFQNLSELFKQTITNFNPNKTLPKDHPFPYLLEQFSNTFNRKFKTFYYHKIINDMFPFEHLVKFMKSLKVQNQEMALVKFRLMFILLFAHLKKDFQLIKAFTSIDFMTCNILERLIMKKFIFSNNIYTKLIHEKYNFSENDCGIIKSILLDDFCPFMEIGIQNDLLNVLEFQDELEIGLKFICFILKRMLLNLKDLEKLIKFLYNIHDRFISGIKFDNIDTISTWLDIFNAFTEILFMVSVNYNDLVIEEYLNNNKSNSFLHTKSESGQLLFKMIIKSCVVVNKHYQLKKDEEKHYERKSNQTHITNIDKKEINRNTKKKRTNPNGVPFKRPDKGILFDKILQLFQESINIFTLTDNQYYYQIINLSKEQLDKYYKQIEFIYGLSFLYESDPKKREKQLYEMNIDIKNCLPPLSGGKVYELTLKLDHLLDKLFSNSDQDLTNDSISLLFVNAYNNLIDEITNQIDDYFLIRTNSKEINKKFIYEIIEKYEHINQFFYGKELQFNYDKLIQELIFSNLDEISLKILVFFSDKKYPKLLNYELLERIISILSIYLLTENGARYFLMGKTLSRLNKVFRRYNFLNISQESLNNNKSNLVENLILNTYILQFILIICKCIHKYKFNIKGQKVLLRFKKNLLNHLRSFLDLLNSHKGFKNKNKKSRNNNAKITKDELIVQFKLHFNLIMKIFNYLSDNYENNTFQEINYELIQMFLNSKHDFSNPKIFYGFYFQNKNENKRNPSQLEILANQNTEEIILTKRSNIDDNLESEENKQLLILTENNAEIKETKHISSPEIDDSLYLNENDKIELNLFYSFFKAFSKNDPFIKANNYQLLSSLNKIFDFKEGEENAIYKLFKSNKLSINKKRTLLKTMNKLFFIERTFNENINNTNIHITTIEYLQYIYENNMSPFSSIDYNEIIKDQKIEKENLNEIELKYLIIKRIELLIQIYINEIENIQKTMNKENIEILQNFLTEIVIAIKRISDFFYYERNLWNKPFILFYQMTKTFLSQIDLIINILGAGDKQLLTHTIDKDIIKLKQINFDVFDRDNIYKHMCNALDYIFQNTNININFSLTTFLDVFDNTQELNYTPFSLIEIKDYEYFYEDKVIPKTKNILIDDSLINQQILNEYIKEFLDINNTNFISVIQNDPNHHNYKKLIVDYFYAYFNCEETNLNMLNLITKILFYDTTSIQKNFQVCLTQRFFINFNSLLQKYLYKCFVLCKNINECSFFIEISKVTKLILQFLQLLGEDFCTDFHDKIFTKVNDANTKTIFENVIDSLEYSVKYILISLDIKKELPYDKMIVLISNLIDFIVEFVVIQNEYSHILQREIDRLFFQGSKIINILFAKCDKTSMIRLQILSFVKIKFIYLIILYIQNGKKSYTVKSLIEHKITPIELYNEILYNFNLLLSNLKIKIPQEISRLFSIQDNDNYVKFLIHLYINYSEFRDTLELEVCFNLYILIKIYETKYNNMDINEHFKKKEIELEYEQIKNTKLNNDNPLEDWNINSQNAFRVYKFLEELILSVEIKTEGVLDPTEETSFISENNELLNFKNANRRNSINISLFNKQLSCLELDNNGIHGETSTENTQITFFVRPFLTYFISKQSKVSFETNVDRDSATAKYMGLINQSDYFLFEMALNRYMTNSKISKFLSDLKYTHLEWVNFIFILIQNIVLVIQYYKPWNISYKEYFTLDKNKWYHYNIFNLIVSIIQCCYILLVLMIWCKYKFYLCFEKNILKNNNMTFIFRQKNYCDSKKEISETIRAFFSENECDVLNLLRNINQSIPLYSQVFTAVFESILCNKEICVFLYTLLLLITYIITKCEMFLVIPILFIANLNPILFSIFLVIKNKIITLATTLLFTYLFMYVFMWITYYYLSEDFVFDDVLNIKTGETLTEPFCYSSIQCWMFIISFGLRAGGGIGDNLSKISFKENHSHFIIRFFYDVLFHLFIVLILLNVFLGIIVDAFAELRNKNWQREKDMNSICFICQLSSDDCLSRNIDYEEHINTTHNLWNYVYYLTYLHLVNVNDLNRINKYVWDKLGNQDYSWIPLENSSFAVEE